jgi:hypothetical protein
VPLDIHAVAANGSGAFALATPLRVRDIVEFAVREAIGPRAPQDRFMRNVHSTLLGLAAGRFTLTVDGRSVCDPDCVLVCGEIADVRFFLTARMPVHH